MHFPPLHRSLQNYLISSIGDYFQDCCTIVGIVKRVRLERGRRSQRLRILIDDGTGQIELLWFQGISYLRNAFKLG